MPRIRYTSFIQLQLFISIYVTLRYTFGGNSNKKLPTTVAEQKDFSQPQEVGRWWHLGGSGGSGKSWSEPLPHGCKMVAAGPAIESTFKAPRQLHLPFFSGKQLPRAKHGVSGCRWP